MHDTSFGKALGLVFAARNYFWTAKLNASRKQSGLDDYASFGHHERLMTRDEAEALMRRYRHGLR
jgi:hypothetical protein